MSKCLSQGALIRLVRPTHWVKNAFVLAPLIFAKKFNDVGAIIDSLGAFLLFSLAASAVYVVNDYCDIENDRKHPIKSLKRPLASGEVTKFQALCVLGVLYGSLAAGAFFYPWVVAISAGYIVLNFAYTIFLKHLPVIDIFIISSGFVLRIYAGAMALQVEVSSWMTITTLCLGLFLASIKRRQELKLKGLEHRNVLAHYSIPLMNRYAETAVTGTLIFYGLFVTTERSSLIITMPFVLYGIFRYWFLAESTGEESPTDTLLQDWQLMLTVLIWAAICIGVSL